mmetsp:Transcript_55782/g.109205  ORF Transcript_55782/g.109205 Transcript_55782/m.109205 type:complete len:110 (+) Transcript_55782:1385-1714(+)
MKIIWNQEVFPFGHTRRREGLESIPGSPAGMNGKEQLTVACDTCIRDCETNIHFLNTRKISQTVFMIEDVHGRLQAADVHDSSSIFACMQKRYRNTESTCFRMKVTNNR